MTHGKLLRCALAACLLLVLFTHASLGAAPGQRSSGGPDELYDPPLRVMSFNLRVPFRLDGFNYWTHRRDLVVDTIRQFGPDVLGTQECVQGQVDHLLAHLEGYDYVGVGRDRGDRRGEMCAVFYRQDRFDALGSGHFWLSQTPDEPGSRGWDAGWRRICTWVHLADRRDGRQFVIFNTHFDVHGREARHQSALLLRQRIAEIAGDVPAIITGDFNDHEDSLTYRALVLGQMETGPAMTDTFREVNEQRRANEGTRHGFGGRTRGPRIDWILTTDGFDTLAADIDRTSRGGRYPSDHFPVTAVLQWNEGEAAARAFAARARAARDERAGGDGG